jgi:hypothetical protein
LRAPEWIPWDQRIRPGDLAPGDLLAPPPGDPRLVPGYVATGDAEIDDVAFEVGLGRRQVLSREGRADAAQRWYEGEYGPGADMAKAAAGTCGTCGFFLPVAGGLRAAFGVCANELAADGRVVHVEYGCGAHSDTAPPSGAGSPLYPAYDDAAVEAISSADLAKPASVEADAAQTQPPAAEEQTEPSAVGEQVPADGVRVARVDG